VYFKTHTRNMELLGGLMRSMPYTAILFLMGAMAIGGLPPFNGFVSKFLVYSGFIGSFRHEDVMLSALLIICTAILAMSGGVSLLTFTKSFGTIFLGSPRSDTIHHTGEVPVMMRIPLYICALFMLMIGLFPWYALKPVYAIVHSLNPLLPAAPDLQMTGSLSSIGFSSWLLIILITILYMLRKMVTHERQPVAGETWGCGYTAPNPALQYTGKSFSKSLAKLFGFITIEGKKYNELKSGSIFPGPRKYSSFYLEFFEIRVIDPVVKQFLRIFGFFGFIHNGKIQLYVLYGFFFVIILIVLSFLRIL